MSTINQAYFNRVRYTLQNRLIGSVVVTEPLGWSSDDKEFSRDTKYHGIFIKMSNSLKFIGNGYEMLKFIYDVGGINEDVRLIKDEKHPKTDIWTRVYDGFLDLSTYSEQDKQISVKFNSGGIQSIIKSREKEKVELTTTTTLDGDTIEELSLIDVELDGREIFLKTTFEIKNTDNSVYMYNATKGQTNGSNYPIPLALVNESHEEAQNPILTTRIGDNDGAVSSGQTGLMFLANSNTQRELKIKFKLNFHTRFARKEWVNWFKFYLNLVVFKNGVHYQRKQNYPLYFSDNDGEVRNKNHSFTFNQTIIIDEGDSLALEVGQVYDGKNGHTSNLEIVLENISLDYFEITENSFFEKTIAKAILPYEIANRLIQLYTGKQSFYSEALGRTDLGYERDGINTGALNGLTHGFWIRGFTNEDERFKPLTTSLSDFITSFGAIWNLGLGVEKIGLRERIRIESLNYFYNRNTTIKLPYPAKKIKRTVAKDYYYSSLEFGYEKGGEYEEAFGLDEYNGKTSFATSTTRIDKKYSKIAKYRADSYGLEFARRKNKLRYSTQDTKYDNNVFQIDLKRGLSSVFQLRKWQDDFQQEPSGTFSPHTAYNLRLSPFNCLLRHSWIVGSGLIKEPTKYIRYLSSNVNSNLTTQLIGGNEYAENGQIINAELKRPKYQPEIVEFEHEVTFNISQALQGTTTILGKEIPNIYGCVAFINENNEIEKGFLLNLKPNGAGKWKLLKVN